jgi:predicted MFS family arabinose efflux permease
MRTVFLISIGMFILSAAAISLIHDTPYHSADAPWSLASLWRKPRFRRYVAFFLAGFFAVYVGQDFVNPYLAQVHDQGFFALGIYSSLAALGTTVLTLVMGRVTDLRGPRAGVGGVLAFLLAGCLLLLLGTNQLT